MLIAAGVFLLIPYVVAVTVGVVERVRYYREQVGFVANSWDELFSAGSLWSLLLLVPACGFIAGNAVAGERVDRSSEFTAYLPISRWSAIVSKAVLAVGVCIAAALLIAGVGYVASGWWSVNVHDLRNARTLGEAIWFGGASAALVFGISWLVSTFSRSSSIAAASGIVSPVLLAGTLALTDYLAGAEEPVTLERWYVVLCYAFGLLGFVLGIMGYLRRAEP
jgi:ABC-type transport system involved in multi-copper enzyme maturation permease subunit